MADREPLADVEGHRDTVRPMAGHEPPHEGRILEGRRSDHDAGRAGIQHRRHAVVIAQPARDLDPGRLPHPRHDRPELVHLSRARIAGAVEVDHVEPPRTRPDELLCHRHGISRVGRHLAEVAAHEADDRARVKVDGRQEVEASLDRGLALSHAAMIAL